jgi:hypothetical protein
MRHWYPKWHMPIKPMRGPRLDLSGEIADTVRQQYQNLQPTREIGYLRYLWSWHTRAHQLAVVLRSMVCMHRSIVYCRMLHQLVGKCKQHGIAVITTRYYWGLLPFMARASLLPHDWLVPTVPVGNRPTASAMVITDQASPMCRRAVALTSTSRVHTGRHSTPLPKT